ncbi:hypothetical protein QTS76_37370 [Micromonospora sp. b486]|nr:hypothetical protein [Micromonospora sp. b486]MDM4784696.1 hypothetical protein [Micromonospora sp. b486]
MLAIRMLALLRERTGRSTSA